MKIISWQRAMCMTLLEKVNVIATYDWEIRSGINREGIVGKFPAPAVVSLKHVTKNLPRRIRFSRQHIYARDNKTCQYCGEKFPLNKLTLDHVIPKSAGGRTSWTNIVAACIDCNTTKADMTPQQAGMKLLSKPIYPGILGSYAKYLVAKNVPKEWTLFLQST